MREDTIERLDALRKQWSLRSRGAAIQRLLDDLLQDLPAEHDVESEQDPQPEDHLQGAIVLVSPTPHHPPAENGGRNCCLLQVCEVTFQFMEILCICISNYKTLIYSVL